MGDSGYQGTGEDTPQEVPPVEMTGDKDPKNKKNKKCDDKGHQIPPEKAD